MTGISKPRKAHTEQGILVNRIRQFHKDVIIAAIPNGGWRKVTEARRLKAEGVLPGFPDLIVMEPRGRYHGLVIEMKRIGGRVSGVQKDLLPRLASRNYKVILGDQGADHAFREVEKYLALGPTLIERLLSLPEQTRRLIERFLG